MNEFDLSLGSKLTSPKLFKPDDVSIDLPEHESYAQITGLIDDKNTERGSKLIKSADENIA